MPSRVCSRWLRVATPSLRSGPATQEPALGCCRCRMGAACPSRGARNQPEFTRGGIVQAWACYPGGVGVRPGNGFPRRKASQPKAGPRPAQGCARRTPTPPRWRSASSRKGKAARFQGRRKGKQQPPKGVMRVGHTASLKLPTRSRAECWARASVSELWPEARPEPQPRGGTALTSVSRGAISACQREIPGGNVTSIEYYKLR